MWTIAEVFILLYVVTIVIPSALSYVLSGEK